jgi:hypothetical protein
LPIANGGSGQTSQQAAINALTAVSGATNEHVLTKDTATGNAIWKAAAGGASLPVVDTTAIVKGSADDTKLLRFEVDGFTSGVTRVLTPPDQDGTLALLERANVFTNSQAIQPATITTPQLLITKPATGQAGIGMLRLRSSADTTLAYFDENGNLRVGSSVDQAGPTGAIFAIGTNTATSALVFGSQGNNTGSPNVNMRKSRGSASSPSVIVAGDSQGSVRFQGFGGTDWREGAKIEAFVSSSLTITNNQLPSYLTFSTNGGSTNTNERMRITEPGRVGINETTPLAQLHVDQTSATGAIPTLRLQQADLSEEFIRFDATVGAGNPIDTAALGAYYGKVRVYVEGVGAKWLALYD